MIAADHTLPLVEALPWSPYIASHLLVCDSLETQADFVMATLLKEILWSSSSSPSSPPPVAPPQKSATTTTKMSTSVYYVTGGPTTNQEVTTRVQRGKRRIVGPGGTGTGTGGGVGSIGGGSGRLTIRCLASEMAQALLASMNDANDDDDDDDAGAGAFDGEKYLKDIYKEIKEWVWQQPKQNVSWIVLDDLSAMATLLGDTTVFCFVDSLFAFVARGELTGQVGFVLRSSNGHRQASYQSQTTGSDNDDDMTAKVWAGAGGLTHRQALQEHQWNHPPSWELQLESMVDTIVDVLPLPSGFSREAHGRLVVSETPTGRGWWRGTATTSLSNRSMKTTFNNGSNRLIVNYCVQDSDVRAIRLRTSNNIRGK